MTLVRSLPGGFEAAGTPPVPLETDTTTTSPTSDKMAKESGFLSFTKTTLLPILIALLLYLAIFHFLLPLYRKHRARYSQYLPLNTASNLTSRLPSSLHPSSLRSRLTDSLLRIFLPSTWAFRHSQHNAHRRGSTTSTLSDTDNILTDESGEAMVGFDYSNNTGSIEDQNRRRRDAMEQQVARGLQAAREMGMGGSEADHIQIPPERRLSRELEEVFRDDSDDDDDEEDGPNAVTVGRRSMSISR